MTSGSSGKGPYAYRFERSSSAIEDVVAEVFHLQDRGIGPADGRLHEMRLDDLAHDDVMVAFGHDGLDAAFDRRRNVVEDRRTGDSRVVALAAQLALAHVGRPEEGKGERLLI